MVAVFSPLRPIESYSNIVSAEAQKKVLFGHSISIFTATHDPTCMLKAVSHLSCQPICRRYANFQMNDVNQSGGKGPNEHTESKASTICGHSDFMHFFCGGKKRDQWRGRRKTATERASKKAFVFVFVQGDHSRCSQPRIVIITKVLFYYESHVVKRNLCFGVNGKEVGNNVNGHHVPWSQHKKQGPDLIYLRWGPFGGG